MSKPRNDGGPAFPYLFDEKPASNGMTLRDYFAAHAPRPTTSDILVQINSDRLRNPHNEPHKPRLRSRSEIIAYYNYKYADAMLAAREQDQ